MLMFIKIALYLKTIYKVVKGGPSLAKEFYDVYVKIKEARDAKSAGGRAITKKELVAITDETFDVLEKIAGKHFKE